MSQPTLGHEIREAYLSFFESREHRRLTSDSLIPTNDPTLLFTGAGMNQFKDEFLGKGRRGLTRATTSQKCLRVPDLENVGATPRHHTFFEMLGNFSFGDYFKAETIPWEWAFFTEVLGWDPDRLVATIYLDDEEAFGIWRETIGLPEERIYRFGEKENFWPAEAPSKGPNGVCGPCSEIYYDQEPGQPMPSKDGRDDLPDRFLEVGNCVFTQFDRRDGGVLEPLPQKNIDVGLGLERIAAVAQEVPNNLETDLFAPTLEAIQSLSGRKYGADAQDDVRMRRIADHVRAVFFCIADGAVPGREGRGYVVRKILRRAVRDGIELGITKPFFAGLLPAVQATMGEAYPELVEQAGAIQSLSHAEEERFQDVYRGGIARLESAIAGLQEQGRQEVFPGAVAFELHDTYGFPVDIAEVVVREAGLELDMEGFEQAMEAQRDRARSGSALSGDVFAESVSAQLGSQSVATTEFLGYELDQVDARVLALRVDDAFVESIAAGQAATVVLDRSPFYAEGGGQVGDRGRLEDAQGNTLFEISDTQSDGGYHTHAGQAQSALAVGDAVHAAVDVVARRATEAHHTATHLLHAALKEIVGSHVNQAGSLVAPDRLRFDFTHPERLSDEQIHAIEDRVQAEVLKAQIVGKRHTSLERAKQEGVVALFGEKYGDEVRVVEVPGYSQELCGGTHVLNTGRIGPFRILSERALAAGVRRIEAVAGEIASAKARADRLLIQELEQSLKAPADRLLERIDAMRAEIKAAKQKRAIAVPDAAGLASELVGAQSGGDPGPAFAWKLLDGVDAQALRGLADQLEKIDPLPGVVLLVGQEEGGVPFVVLCKKESGFRAGDLAKAFGQQVGGGGGGRPNFAQGRGTQADRVSAGVEELMSKLQTPA